MRLLQGQGQGDRGPGNVPGTARGQGLLPATAAGSPHPHCTSLEAFAHMLLSSDSGNTCFKQQRVLNATSGRVSTLQETRAGEERRVLSQG